MGRYAYSERRARRGRSGCLQGCLALLFLAALAALVYTVALRPLVTRVVAEQIIGGPVPTLMPQGAVSTAVIGGAGGVFPTAVAALPVGQIVVSDADVNAFLASRPEALAPLESASVSFTGGKARAQVSAGGFSGIATVGLAAQGGQVIVTDVAVDAPLSYVISGQELAAALATRLNAELAAQGRTVDQLIVEEGRIILVVS